MGDFYTLLRIRVKKTGDYIANAVKYDNYDTVIRQFYSLISTDLGDSTLAYHSCQIIDSRCLVVESKFFSHEEEATNE